MILRKKVMLGDSLEENQVPPPEIDTLLKIPGSVGNKSVVVGLTEKMLQMHVLLMGGTGSGKTNTIKHMIPQIQNSMGLDDVMLIFDSKLDFEEFHRNTDYIITYRKNSRGTDVIWNLFMELVADGWGKNEIYSNADEMAEVIFAQAVEKSSQPFFPTAARDILSAIIKAITILGINDKNYRIQYMNNKALLRYLTSLDAKKLNEFLSPIPELAGVLKYVGNGKSDQALGVFAELQSVVNKVFTRNFSLDGRFSVRKTVNDRLGKTLFIEYDPSKGKALQPVYQVLIDLFLKEALNPNREKKGRVFVICDELKMLPHVNHLEDALNFGRSLGVSVIAGIQSMQQLYEVYGEFGGKNIAAAFQTVFCFHTNDEASRQYIKGIYGQNVSVIQYMDPSGKTSEEKYNGYSIEDWEIVSLQCGEAIVGLPYYRPFKVKMSKYRRESMGSGFNTAASLVASMVNRSNRKKTIKKINRVNEANKNVQNMGTIMPDQIIPCNYQMGNIAISGGSIDIRNELIIQNCKQSVSIGIPTVIIHEGNYRLEFMLQNVFSGHRYFRMLNTSNPYYDPIFRLTDTETGHFISDAAPVDHPIGSDGVLYIKALSTILRKRGVTPYLRMFASCPHNAVNNVILRLEQGGTITAVEADNLRNDIVAGNGARADIEYFFQQLELEASILVWKSKLSRCTSVAECILHNGIMSIDVTYCSKKNQMALISTEIEHCAKTGTPFRVIIDAVSIADNDKLINSLKRASHSVAWTIVSPDMNRMIGNAQGELATWLALSHRAILFSHGIKTSELLSSELGEYEHIEVVESHAGNNNIGRIGYHFGANSGFSTSSKRKSVIKPEELEGLNEREFILLDNYMSQLSRGIIA